MTTDRACYYVSILGPVEEQALLWCHGEVPGDVAKGRRSAAAGSRLSVLQHKDKGF